MCEPDGLRFCQLGPAPAGLFFSHGALGVSPVGNLFTYRIPRRLEIVDAKGNYEVGWAGIDRQPKLDVDARIGQPPAGARLSFVKT